MPSWHIHSRHLIPATQLYEIWCTVQLKIIFCLTVQYKMMQNKKNLLKVCHHYKDKLIVRKFYD